MEKRRILSGEQIVAKGITKIDATLPEVGLKDIAPNGSWLEQKQIQAALEARKHLVEVERIEKCGSLSHAEWREDVKLAEVTQKTGSYWQYLGHNVGKTLYLKPEEALFLLELNCLHLKHNNVTVSLQTAYSLLLRETISIHQYKVYAALSRLGYKVFRHKEVVKTKKKCTDSPEEIKENDDNSANVNDSETCKNVNVLSLNEGDVNIDADNVSPIVGNENKMELDQDTPSQPCDSGVYTMEVDTAKSLNTDLGTKDNNESQLDNTASTSDNTTSVNSDKPYCTTKLEKLRSRQLKPTNSKTLLKLFENIPDLFEKQIVTINVPDEEYLPKNVFVNKSSYMLNIESIRMKSMRPVSSGSAAYSITDEVNGEHVRRIRNNSANETSQITNTFPNHRYSRPVFNFRPFNHWRPQNNLNYYQFGMYFQRPMFQNMYFLPRYQFHPRPHYMRHFIHNRNANRIDTRKRCRDLKSSQLNGIKVLAARFKQLIMVGTPIQNIQPLQRLLHTYNMKYKTKLRLTNNFDVVNDETIIETIELDDDDESRNKRPRYDDEENTLKDENINRLRQVALKLKDLDHKNKATARHRRALSNAIKTFNKSYNSDVYLNSNYEVLDRSHITLDSNSETDCVVEKPKNSKGKKLLRNPFNIMKRLSEKINTGDIASTSEEAREILKDTHYDNHIKNTFNKHWLPNEDDFGRAEVVSKSPSTHFTDQCKEEYILDFINDQPKNFKNWLEAKILFLKHIEDTNIAFQQNQLQNVQELSYPGLHPLISTDDFLDMHSVLEKLRIIENNKEINTQADLRIDFDVYNRDVPNFRKTNPPKPHFRVICMHESSSFPSAADIAALYFKYEENVAIVFAIVGSTVAYLQINPTDLPIYVPSNDLV